MSVSYKKLWHILLDMNMKKNTLAKAAGISAYAIKKLSRDEAVTTDVLEKICAVLNCTPNDIMEFTSNENQISTVD